MKDKIMFLVIGILIGAILSFFIYNFTLGKNINQPQMPMDRNGKGGPFGDMREPPEKPGEENKEKETKVTDIEEGQKVTETNIDLSNYSSNITITEAGEYTLNGEFKHSILINSESDVVLTLNCVNIKNDITATIVNISQNPLVIKLADNMVVL